MVHSGRKPAFLTAFVMFMLLAAPLRADAPAYAWADTLNYTKVRALITAYAKLAHDNPKDYDSRVKTAQLSFYGWRLEKESNRRRLELAKLMLKVSKEAIALDPNRAEAYMWAGAGLGCVGLTRGILSSLQLIPQGKEYLEKSISVDPNYFDAGALLLLGRAYTVVPGFPLSVGDKTKALKLLRLAKTKAPSSTLIEICLADLLWAHEHNTEAIAILEKIADNKPKSEFEHFMFETNKRKAQEMIALIKTGTPRDPFFDVVSDIQPGIFE